MALNIPVPISDLPRVGSLYPSYLFITEKDSVTHSVSWNKLLSDLTNLPGSITFGYGSAGIPAIGFVDSSAGFFAPQIGAVAVETSNKQRFTIGPSGIIEFGLNGVEDTLNTITSPPTMKCGVRLNQDFNVDQDVKISGDLVIYGKINFDDVVISGQGNGDNLNVSGGLVTLGTNCNVSTLESYNRNRVYCNVIAEENVEVTGNVVTLAPLNIPDITVGNTSSLHSVSTSSILKVDDGGVVTFDPTGDLTTTGNITAGKIFGNGRDLTNLNIPTSLRIKGSIDPTTSAPPVTPQDGDVWYSIATGNFTTGWVGVEGDPVRIGQSFYYRAVTNSNPTATWVIGGLSDLQSPFFMFINLDQTVTGSHTHSTVINTTNDIDTGGADITANTLELNIKAISTLTVGGYAGNTLTTKSYVDDRMANSILDFPLQTSKYIIGQSYNGSSAQTWALDTSPTGTDNLVARNDEGNFAANIITATFLDGRSLDSDKLDVNYPTVNGDYPILFTPSVTTSQVIYSHSGFTHNPITDTLSVDVILGDVTGDVTGNANTTTAFESSRDIWSQSFDGTDDVTGNIFFAGNILSETNNTKDIGSSANVWQNIYANTFHGRFEGDVEIGDSLEYTLTNGTHVLGGSWDGSSPITWSIRCDSNNTPDFIVVRDASGNFSSNVIAANEFVGSLTGDVTGNISGSSGSVTGNSVTFTAFETERTLWGQTFDATGDVSGSIETTGNVTPQTTSTYDIGSTTLPYKTLYIDAITGDVPNNGTSTDKVNNPLIRGSYLEGTFPEWNGSLLDAWLVDPRSRNAPDKTVLRDVSGNFDANVITATFNGPLTGDVTGNVSGSSSSITGNAFSATRFETPRDIWSHSFDGTQNVSGNIPDTGNILPAINDDSDIGREDKKYSDVYAGQFHGYFDTVVPEVSNLVNKLSPGPYISGDPWDGSSELYWNVYARSDNVINSVVLRDVVDNFEAGRITSDLVGYVTGNITGSVDGSSTSVTGNSATISKLENTSDITVSVVGTFAGSGTTQFDGSDNIEVQFETVLDQLDISTLNPLPQ